MQENGSIQELPLSLPFFRKEVEAFLRENGLRMEELDHYYACTSPDGSILAGAGIKADIIKCVAVAPSARSEGFMLPLLSRVVSDAAAKGVLNLKVFTKPENREIFESIGFKVLASAPKAVLMENGRGLEKYCEYLHSQRKPDARICGVIVMNANPFTLGHKYLIEKALEQVDHLFVIPVKEDASAFPYPERLAMIRAASALPCPKNQFSSANANPAHADAVSASRVRAAIEAGDYASAAALCPVTTHPYLLAALAERALMMELDTPMKPGLVGPDGPGAHKDMDYDTMLRGIKALRPFWSRMAMASGPDELRSLGIEAEKAMLSATGGVNTHRGAIFCLGIALNAVGRRTETIDNEQVMQNALCEIAQGILHNYLNDNKLHSTLVGARRIALTGYRELFTDWLPFYRIAVKDTLQKTLLRIMSTLDDTCVIKRVGHDRAQEVKREAAALLASAQPSASASPTLADALKALCIRYAQEGISPGGAADMLALTIFFDSII